MEKPEITILQGRRLDVTAAAEFMVAVGAYQRLDDAANAEWWAQRRGTGRMDAHSPGGVLAEHERARSEMLGALALLIGCDDSALMYGL